MVQHNSLNSANFSKLKELILRFASNLKVSNFDSEFINIIQNGKFIPIQINQFVLFDLLHKVWFKQDPNVFLKLHADRTKEPMNINGVVNWVYKNYI
jgi:hypothetical protein